ALNWMIDSVISRRSRMACPPSEREFGEVEAAGPQEGGLVQFGPGPRAAAEGQHRVQHLAAQRVFRGDLLQHLGRGLAERCQHLVREGLELDAMVPDRAAERLV